MQSDVVADFLAAMEAEGVHPVEPIAQRLGGPLIRFRCDGDGAGKRNGWARLHFDGIPAGAFGNYRLGVSQKWRSGVVESLTPEERRKRARELRQLAEVREAERQAMWADVAAKAEAAWEQASRASPAHPYLQKKRIEGEGLRQAGRALLVPMCDLSGRLWNIQRIYPDGLKVFGPVGCGSGNGGRIEGLFWLCGEPDAGLCVGEGMATMAAVRRATGLAVAASFTGGNLEPVARALRSRWPDLDLIICGDDDRGLVDHPRIRKNLGLEYAHAAAAAVGGRVAVPPRGEDQ